MTAAMFKRFYKQAAAEPVPPDANRPGAEAGYRVVLDGRPIKTPAKADMVLPTRALAEAIAEEWQAQGAEVSTRDLPLTGLVWTAIDLIRPNPTCAIDEIVAHAAHDLLCYRAEAPADLVARQQAVWQPLLDWLALTCDAPLVVTAGIVSIEQPASTLESLRKAVATKGDLDLAALATATTATGSAVIGLALSEGHIDAEAAFAAAQLEETHQIERWGEDAEAARRRAAIKADLDAAARLMNLLRR